MKTLKESKKTEKRGKRKKGKKEKRKKGKKEKRKKGKKRHLSFDCLFPAHIFQLPNVWMLAAWVLLDKPLPNRPTY